MSLVGCTPGPLINTELRVTLRSLSGETPCPSTNFWRFSLPSWAAWVAQLIEHLHVGRMLWVWVLRQLIFCLKKMELSSCVVALHCLVSMTEFACTCIYLSADDYLREGVSLWWLQDTRFKIPRVNMHCSIESVRAEKSPRWMGTLCCILYLYRYTLRVQYMCMYMYMYIIYSRRQEKSNCCNIVH